MPRDEPGSLIFASRTVGAAVQRIWLNDTQTVRGLFNASECTGVIRSMEMSHRNRTVCVLCTSSVVCHSVDSSIRSGWPLPMPDLMMDMRQIALIRLDWTSGNWYLVSRERGTIIVCNAAMRHCTIVVDKFLKVRSLALDPTKG